MLNYTLNRKTKSKQVRRFSESPVRLINVDNDQDAKRLLAKGLGSLNINTIKNTVKTLQSAYDFGLLSLSFNYGKGIDVYEVQDYYIAIKDGKVVGLIKYAYDRVAYSHHRRDIETTTSVLLWKDNTVKADLSLQKIIFDKIFPKENSVLSDTSFSLEGERNWHSFVKKSFTLGYHVYGVHRNQIATKFNDFTEYEKAIKDYFGLSFTYQDNQILVTKEKYDLDPIHTGIKKEDLWS